MSECQQFGELQRLLELPLDDPELKHLEQHLDACPSCRERVAMLDDVRTLIPGDSGRWQTRSSSSDALKQAIDQLQRQPMDGPAPAALPLHTELSLSFLSPTSEPDFLGRLGGYEVRRVVGQGASGIVLEALDPLLKRTVAIKMLSPWSVLDEQTKVRFLREAQSAAALTHENVVTIYAVQQVAGMPLLVLEYVAGASLQERVQAEGKLPLALVARIGAQVARGLAAAHSRGLIHRDIKPANILLAEDTDLAKVADFGLAKTAGDEGLTMMGTLLGTPEFMSPEQALGKQPDERSDLFSLGTVLYYAATGVSPFWGRSVLETLDNVRRCQPRPLAQIDPSLPDWFCDLVHRLLAKEPQDRLGWASAVAELLEGAGTNQTVVARLASQSAIRETARGAGAPSKARNWVIAAACAMLLGLVAGGVLVARRSPNESNAQAVTADSQSLSAPQPPMPQAPRAGFVVAGKEQVFDGLAAAIAAAEDGAEIDVYGNGPYLVRPITIAGKRLTIRAAGSSHPLFLPESLTARETKAFLASDSDLRLEGLEIHWAMEPRPGLTEADMMERTIVSTTHGQLAVSHCRIVTERINGCLGGSCRDVVIQRSHLLAKSGGGFFWRVEAGGSCAIDECVVEARAGVSLMINDSSGSSPGRFRMTRSTMSASQGFQLMLDSRPRQPLPITVQRSVLDSEFFFLVAPIRPRAKIGRKSDDVPGMARMTAAWNEEGNVYGRGTQFLARPVLAQKATPVSAGIIGVDQWLEFWKLSADKSIEGEIRFQPRTEQSARMPLTLEAVDNPSGPLPSELGARADRIGPGAAYHAWRNSPEYAAWPTP